MRPALIAICVLACTCSAVRAQWVPPHWQLHRLGLLGPLFTGTEGIQSTYIPGRVSGDNRRGISRFGFVIGNSIQFDGITEVGVTGWVWSPSSPTRPLELSTPEFTSPTGQRWSQTEDTNANGLVIGASRRYGGGTPVQPWLWNSSTGVFQEVGPGANDGSVTVTVKGISNSDIGFGNNTREDGSIRAWSWDASIGTQRIGLTGGVYTTPAGYERSEVLQGGATLNGSDIVGTAGHTNSPVSGASGWAWSSAAGTERIGLYGGEYTSPEGREYTSVTSPQNKSNVVLGYSERFVGSTMHVAWAWQREFGSTSLGFTDTVHTGNGGERESNASAASADGTVIGTSKRWETGATIGRYQLGQSAWVWNRNTGHTRIGLIGPSYTGTDNSQDSSPAFLTDSGFVAGTSYTYSPHSGFSSGVAAWRWSASQGTVRVGLYDSDHTGTIAEQCDNQVIAMNEAGAVIGTASRYVAPFAGRDGWYFDPVSQTSIFLQFSVRADGYARTDPQIVTPSGWVLGLFYQYQGTSASERGFLWSMDRGFVDLGDLVNGVLGADGWVSVSALVGAQEAGLIVGQGSLVGGTTGPNGRAPYGAFAMSIPSPATSLLLASVLLWHRRGNRRGVARACTACVSSEVR